VKRSLVIQGPATKLINLNQRTVIPGLNDSHLHLIRAGLNYNMELRWDGVPSLAEALRMLKVQVQRTQPPQWVRVVGGWTPAQFAEKRFPTLAEINEASLTFRSSSSISMTGPSSTRLPCVRWGMTRSAKFPIGSRRKRLEGKSDRIIDREAERDHSLFDARARTQTFARRSSEFDSPLHARAQSPRSYKLHRRRRRLSELPDDYKVVEQLHQQGQLTTRIAYNLFTQKPKEELADFSKWSALLQPRQGDEMYRHNGAGEMLVYTAADFEDFVWPRPNCPRSWSRS